MGSGRARRAGGYQSASVETLSPPGRVPRGRKIAACAKYVPESTAARRIDPQTKQLDRAGEGALNPFDVNAVEEALRLKEAGDGEVVIVSLGPERALEAMR